jgi:DNA-binding LacI/PurR family transcriptional regulator
MQDIAAVTGVSQSTVSRVLNDSPTRVPIAPETRERVIEAARKLGYRPNPMARALRGAATMLMGAVVRDLSDPVTATAIEALAVETTSHGYNIILGSSHGRATEYLALTAVLEPRHCDAIVIFGDMQDQRRLLEDLRTSIVPVVAIWPGAGPIDFPTVDIDDRAGVVAGLEHLTGLGHERIAFISAATPEDNRHREDAYADFMRQRFGVVRDGYVQRVHSTMSGAEAALQALMGLPDPPTAISASTDAVAVGVLQAACSGDLSVPAELSVIGFGDFSLAAHSVPALTTMRMPITEMVAEGVRKAIEFARDDSIPREPRVTMFEPVLLARQSTAPVRSIARSA